MRLYPKILIYVTLGVFLGAKVNARTSDRPLGQYQSIPDRNVFGLQPPPQPISSNPPAAPLPKITLTGVTTILGDKRALLKIAPAGVKPGEANKEQSLILTEGQRAGDIEVLQIDENVGSVKVNNGGTVMLLTFERDGAKLPPTSSPPPVTAPVTGVPPAMGAMPVGAGAAQTNPYSLPARGLRGQNPRAPGSVTPAANPYTGTTVAPVGGVPTPTGLTGAPSPTQPATQQDITPEEQAIIIELQRQANASNPTSALLPPTPLTPNEATQPSQGVLTSGFVPGKPAVLVPQ
jgi:hypothetical protein